MRDSGHVLSGGVSARLTPEKASEKTHRRRAEIVLFVVLPITRILVKIERKNILPNNSLCQAGGY
jgi:hypothetical protein